MSSTAASVLWQKNEAEQGALRTTHTCRRAQAIKVPARRMRAAWSGPQGRPGHIRKQHQGGSTNAKMWC